MTGWLRIASSDDELRSCDESRCLKPTPGSQRSPRLIAFGISKPHALVDGNKRMDFVMALTLLRMNGYFFGPEAIQGVKMIENLTTGEVSEADIARWSSGEIVSVDATFFALAGTLIATPRSSAARSSAIPLSRPGPSMRAILAVRRGRGAIPAVKESLIVPAQAGRGRASPLQ